MNPVDFLLKKHSKAQKNTIVKYIGNNPKRFAGLVDVFLKGPYRITQWASWPLSSCVELHPNLIKPHLKKILTNVMKPGQHDAVKRNTIRLLQYIDIPKSLQGLAADVCFQLLSDIKEPVAIRAFSITVLSKLALEQPDLKNELIPIIEQQLPYSSAAFVSRARKALKELKTL